MTTNFANRCFSGASFRRSVLQITLLSFSLPLQFALAIGPDNQTLNPTDDSVVRILYDRGTQAAGDGYFNGTGTIIGNHDIDGVGWLCILTADHVISTDGTKTGATVNSPGFAFDNSVKTSGDSPYFVGQVLGRYGTNGTSDIAVLGVPYGAYNAGYNGLVRNLVSASAFFNFSDIGYGNAGTLVAGGYNALNTYGTERFLNSQIGVFQANYTRDGYTFEGAKWFVQDPADTNSIPGSGTTFDADSGSPYFSSAQDHDESTGLNYFTDNLFAVHSGTILATATNNPAPAKPFGTANIGDALTGNDIVWIENLCDAVPEPGSLVLLAPAGLYFIFRRRQRKE